MSRGVAVTVYVAGDEARDGRAYWSRVFSREAENFPCRIEGHNGGDWDVNEDFVQYWSKSLSRKSSHSVKGYNPWIGTPYIVIDDKKYYLDVGQEESELTKLPNRSDYFYVYSVTRIPDSDNFKEYELYIYR